MTVEIDEPGLRQPTAPAGVDEPGGALFPARAPAVTWPATTATRDEVAARLARPPFVLDRTGSQGHRVRGVGLLLDWLSDQPGHSWQQRWMASGADAAAAGWRRVPGDWLHRHDHFNLS